METNIYSIATPKKLDLDKSDKNTTIFNFLIQHLQPKTIITHDVDAERYVQAMNLSIPILSQKHFAIGWSKNKTHDLVQEIINFL